MPFDEGFGFCGDVQVLVPRCVVDAFLAAAREGDFERLITVLDPDIVLRADGGALALSECG